MNISKKALAVFAVSIFLGSIMVCYGAYTLWHGTVTWTVAETGFAVYNKDGVELPDPYEPLSQIWKTGEHSIDFQLENQGNVPITISVQNEIKVGCTAIWSGEGTWTLEVTTAKTLVTLTLDVETDGSYVWEFESIAT